MKTDILRISSIAVLAAALFCSCGNDIFEKPDYYSRTASTEFGQKVVDGSSDYIAHVKQDVQTHIADGLDLLDMGYLNKNGHAMRMFIYRISLGPVSVIASDPEGELLQQKLTSQAAAIENQGRYTVLGAVSAGMRPETSDNFFAVLNDGSAICGTSDDYEKYESRIVEGAGGDVMLLKDGYVLNQTDVATVARSAVGVSEDGNEVYLVVVDGGDFYYSNGIGCDDLALLMKGCGAGTAITLSSGSEVTAVWRNERLESLFGLLNKPSDKGLEAEISGGLVIVKH